MGFVKKCTKCGRELSLDNFYNHPTGKYYAADLERRREMNRIYKERQYAKERYAKENAERIEILKASELLGGYRIYVLNHCKEGEVKYTCVKVSTAEVYRTNDKRKFLSYLEGVI